MMRHIIPISGKDSCAAAIFQMTHKPRSDYELFFNDVGTELPETYRWLDKVERTLNQKIHRIGKSLEEVIFEQGMLPSAHVRFCTKYGKIKPMEEWIGDSEATIYFGIRADEERVGYQSRSKVNLIAVYPLQKAGLGLPQVYQILDKYDLHPPTFFWDVCYQMVQAKLDKRSCVGFPGLMPTAEDIFKRFPRWLFNSLFAWRSRTNCYFCFFQRRYEWAGLLEHHPKLFDRAEELENGIGQADRRENAFTWISGYPLSKVRENQVILIKKRAVEILRQIDKRMSQPRDVADLLSLTSCGLFCGK